MLKAYLKYLDGTVKIELLTHSYFYLLCAVYILGPFRKTKRFYLQVKWNAKTPVISKQLRMPIGPYHSKGNNIRYTKDKQNVIKLLCKYTCYC